MCHIKETETTCFSSFSIFNDVVGLFFIEIGRLLYISDISRRIYKAKYQYLPADYNRRLKLQIDGSNVNYSTIIDISRRIYNKYNIKVDRLQIILQIFV